MRLCGPLLLGLLLLSLPAWAQVERNSSDLNSRQRAAGSSHRGGWITPDHDEEEQQSVPAWNYRQEQAVRRVFRSITTDGQDALAQFSKPAMPESGGRQTIVAQTIPQKPEPAKPSFRLKRDAEATAEFPEFVEETDATSNDDDTVNQAIVESTELLDAELLDEPTAAEPAEEEVEETPAAPAPNEDSPSFRIRRDMDGSRHADSEFDFPADDELKSDADSAPELFLDPDQPEAITEDAARIDRGFIPDTAEPKTAQLKPASGSLSRTSGVQAPLALPDNPGRIADYKIRSDISKITRGNSKLKQVALTFDDGPHPEYTGQILTILEYYNCPATFFFVGVQANKYPQWVQMAHQQGHEIASQTYDHFRLPKLPKGEKEYQIDAYQDLIEDLTGERPRFLRPPGGQIDDASIELLKQRGMVCAMWDVALNDTHGDKTKQELLDHTLDSVKNGSVILAHDGVQATIDMLPELIERLREEGYELVTMSELASKL
ncbi:MAG: polysaccharide deacetylase family protein [Planctomycetales bacterium]|nr:polysaccharide deacetylase family protein [bacterium]UNM08968.1 MAG: polysaccharide deacetylase family protein [Planctomycetales bacterium]